MLTDCQQTNDPKNREPKIADKSRVISDGKKGGGSEKYESLSYSRAQFSMIKVGTRLNSLVLFVTRVKPRLRA